MYRDYRKNKKEGLVELSEKRVTRTVEENSDEQNEVDVSFHLKIKRFSEKDGSEVGSFTEELDLEALKKERILQQGFLEDLNELIIDMEENCANGSS